MKLLRKRDILEEKYTNAFLGYGPEESHFVIELTYSQCCYTRHQSQFPPVTSAVCSFQVPDFAESIRRLRGRQI